MTSGFTTVALCTPRPRRGLRLPQLLHYFPGHNRRHGPMANTDRPLLLAEALQPFKRANAQHMAHLGRASMLIIATD